MARKRSEHKGARLENIKRRTTKMKMINSEMKKCTILISNVFVANRLDTKFKTVLKIQTLGRARIQRQISPELRRYKTVVSYLPTPK